MLVDVVVDTNVFEHAENPGDGEYEPSRRFIESLLTFETHICLDDKNRLVREYISRLPPGALALVLLQECAATERISHVSMTVPRDVLRAITSLVADGTDHKFVRVAYKSRERVLVTHDDEHLHAVSSELADQISVELLDAYGCCKRL